MRWVKLGEGHWAEQGLASLQKRKNAIRIVMWLPQRHDRWLSRVRKESGDSAAIHRSCVDPAHDTSPLANRRASGETRPCFGRRRVETKSTRDGQVSASLMMVKVPPMLNFQLPARASSPDPFNLWIGLADADSSLRSSLRRPVATRSSCGRWREPPQSRGSN